jgi:hypothetical protein
MSKALGSITITTKRKEPKLITIGSKPQSSRPAQLIADPHHTFKEEL